MDDSQAKYLQDLNAVRESTLKRVKQGRAVKALKENAPELFELIDLEISIALSKMTGDKPLSHEEYLSAHGEVKMGKRLRDVMQSREIEEPTAAEQARIIDEQLKNATTKS